MHTFQPLIGPLFWMCAAKTAIGETLNWGAEHRGTKEICSGGSLYICSHCLTIKLGLATHVGRGMFRFQGGGAKELSTFSDSLTPMT